MKNAIGTALFLVLLAPLGATVRGQSPDTVVRALGRSMLEQLQSESLEKRETAVRTLGRLGPVAKGAIPALTRMARNDPVGEVRFAALRVLGTLGPEARSALPAIREALKDEDRLVRVFAAEALMRLEPGEQDVAVRILADALRYSMREPAEVPSFFVFGVLMNLGPRGRGAEAALVEVVRNGRSSDRLDAVRVLEVVGCPSETLVPLLIGVLKDRYHQDYLRIVGQGMTLFLSPLVSGRVPDGLRVLRYELRDVTELAWVSREICADILGRLGPRAAAAVPALQEALEDPYPSVRQAARQALHQIQARP